jgi:hypothetical protein
MRIQALRNIRLCVQQGERLRVNKIYGDVALHAKQFKTLAATCAKICRMVSTQEKAVLKAADPSRLSKNASVLKNLKWILTELAQSLLAAFWPSSLWMFAAQLGEWRTPFHVNRNEAAKGKMTK